MHVSENLKTVPPNKTFPKPPGTARSLVFRSVLAASPQLQAGVNFDSSLPRPSKKSSVYKQLSYDFCRLEGTTISSRS